MEVWIPFGHVEALLTIQIENLGELVDPKAENRSTEVAAQLSEKLKDAQKLIVCDNKGATLKSLKTAFGDSPTSEGLKVYSPWPKEVELSVPLLKGRVSKFSKEREKFVDEGEIIGTPLDCAIGAAASDWFDEFSPISATTPFAVISFVTTEAASSALP